MTFRLALLYDIFCSLLYDFSLAHVYHIILIIVFFAQSIQLSPHICHSRIEFHAIPHTREDRDPTPRAIGIGRKNVQPMRYGVNLARNKCRDPLDTVPPREEGTPGPR